MGHLLPREADPFHYIGPSLFCDGVPLADVAHRFDTPTNVYSQAELLRNATSYLTSSEKHGQSCLVCYALKANGNPELLQILSGTGLGADIVSGGELFLAQNSGFAPQRIVFSGVGKTQQEIEEAIAAGVLSLHVESEGELGVISRIAKKLEKVAPIAVRVNPEVNVDTHAHIATGGKEHKFGVPPETASSMMSMAQNDHWLHPLGLSAHLGSQIMSLEPYIKVAERMGTMADELEIAGLNLDYIDLGGGLAIDYGQGPGPTIDSWLENLTAIIESHGCRLIIEPGRSIIGPAGILLTKVLYTKRRGYRIVVVTDAGMTDLIRPALYGASHPILPVVRRERRNVSGLQLHEIVGPVCESADVLARDVSLAAIQPGDLLAILKVGAYGYAMSSNYNGRLRPAEVLVTGDLMRCIRRRERYGDLLGDPVSEQELHRTDSV